MDIEQLRYFIAAAEAQSFARAAESCYTSRQNVARSVQSLENELGVTLFSRKGNAIVLTQPGEQAAERARRVIAEFEALLGAFRNEAVGDELKIEFGSSLLNFLPNDFLAFLGEYKKQSINISESSNELCYEKVRNGQVDVSIVFCMKRTFPGCRAIPLDASHFHALVSEKDPLASLQMIDVSKLGGRKLVLLGKPEFQFKQLVEDFEALGYSKNDIDVITTVRVMKHIVREQNAIAIVNESPLFQELHGLTAIPFSESKYRWVIYALYNERSERTREISSFISHLKSYFQASEKE